MAAKTLTVPFDKLSGQMGELLMNGGTLGDVYGYDDRDYEVLYALGHSLYSQGRYADAVKAFGFLVMHNHLERRFASAYASSLQMTRQYDKAIEFYTLASMMDMSDPVPTFHTAECMMQVGMMAQAKEALGFVVKQSEKPEHEALKVRAVAMLELLEKEAGK